MNTYSTEALVADENEVEVYLFKDNIKGVLEAIEEKSTKTIGQLQYSVFCPKTDTSAVATQYRARRETTRVGGELKSDYTFTIKYYEAEGKKPETTLPFTEADFEQFKRGANSKCGKLRFTVPGKLEGVDGDVMIEVDVGPQDGDTCVKIDIELPVGVKVTREAILSLLKEHLVEMPEGAYVFLPGEKNKDNPEFVRFKDEKFEMFSDGPF